MSAVSRLRYFQLAYFSSPHSDRAIYKAIFRQRWHRFLEIGIGRGVRARRMFQIAAERYSRDQVRYVGIDLFEARINPAGGLNLKEAHRLFKAMGVSAQFVPGDAFSALSRAANSLGELDAVVISADQDAQALDRAWFYLPRVLHAASVVFLEEANAEGVVTLATLNRSQVEARVRKTPRRAA